MGESLPLPPHAPRRQLGSALLAALIGSALAVVLFSSTGHDDCHITFWSAWSLSELGEIVNHSGERVEQSSSLLHTLLLAAVYELTGAPIPWIAYLLGIFAAVLTVLRLPALARASGWEPTFPTLLLMATTPGFAYWQLGMLESSLFTFLGVEFLVRLARLADRSRAPGALAWVGLALWTGALALTRPEAAIVAMCVAGGLALVALLPAGRRADARGWRGPAAAFLLAGAWFGALVAFRRAYFGASFPHPVSSKVGSADSLSLHELGVGVSYLVERFSSVSGSVLLAGLALGLVHGWRDLRRGRLASLLPLLFVGAYAAFAVSAGGDWMLGWRFVAHVEPLFVFLLLQALSRIELAASLRRGILWLALTANLVGLLGMAATVGTGMPLWTAWQIDPAVRAFSNEEATWPERANQVHVRDLVMVDELDEVLERILAKQETVTVLSKQGGLLMYYAAKAHYGKLEFYDRLGLVSSHFDELKREFEIPTGQFGLSWTIYDVFWLSKVRDDPALHPDVVFDLHDNSRFFLDSRDYATVYEQTGTIDCRYVPYQENLIELAKVGLGSEDEEEPLEFSPEQGRDERRALLKDHKQSGKEQRFRDRLKLRLPEGRPFWRASTPMYQYISVRAELARETDLLPVDEVREVLGDDAPLTRHDLAWNDDRRPYLRFLLDPAAPGVGNAPASLPRLVPVVARATSSRAGRQRIRVDADDRIPGSLFVAAVQLGGRELDLEADVNVARNGTEAPEVVLLESAGAAPGDSIEIRGYTFGEAGFDVRAEVVGAQR